LPSQKDRSTGAGVSESYEVTDEQRERFG